MICPDCNAEPGTLCICAALDQPANRFATLTVLILCAAVYLGAFLVALGGGL